MMMPDLDLAARAIAENVVSAFQRGCERAFEEGERERAIQGLMRELLLALPATSGEVLAFACNRHLSVLADCGMHGPRVETVSLVDGAVTMRER